MPGFAGRFSASADIFDRRGRRTWASINFITAHDGFTLNDLVSYSQKYNKKNGQDNRDGSDNNFSWNCGIEGETDAPDILALRRRQMRNFLATLIFSQGVPMLTSGDEFARSQQGNNNAYCQDNEISWLNWEGIDDIARTQIAFVNRLLDIRRSHIVFHRNHFFQGEIIAGTDVKDVIWLRPDGREMGIQDWKNLHARALGIRLSGEAGIVHLTETGKQEPDDTFLLLVNANREAVVFVLPDNNGGYWEPLVDTVFEDGHPVLDKITPKMSLKVGSRSLQLLRWVVT